MAAALPLPFPPPTHNDAVIPTVAKRREESILSSSIFFLERYNPTATKLREESHLFTSIFYHGGISLNYLLIKMKYS